MSRYRKRRKAVNNLKFHRKLLDSRGVRRVEQYRTQPMRDFEESDVEYYRRAWIQGDSFWNLSNEVYGDPSYWYLIARFNNTPTEAHVNVGDVIKIPINLTTALQVIG